MLHPFLSSLLLLLLLLPAGSSVSVPIPCPGVGYDLGACAALAVVAALLLWCLRLAKGLSFTLGIGERHAGLRPERRRRRRRRRGRSLGHGELERPLLDMELLPQIIDTLHRQHNIKIKEV